MKLNPMSMYLRLAWRNIWRNRRRTIITVSSVMFAVVLSLFLDSMNRGSHNHMIDITARFHTGYIQIQHPQYRNEPSLDNTFEFSPGFADSLMAVDEEIDYIVPRIESFVLAAGDEQTRGALVMGIDRQKEQQLNGLLDRLTDGDFFEQGASSAVLGEGLARRMNMAVGDTIALLGQGRYGMTAAGLYEISGLIDHPLSEMGTQIIYLSLPVSQQFFSAEGFVTSVLVTPHDVDDTDTIAASLDSVTDGLRVLTWPELMPELLQGLEFDRVQQYLMTGILYVVIGFGLFGTVLTMTLERMREFSLLMSLGMQRRQLSGILFMETLAICFLGVIVGSIIGLPVIYYFYKNPIELSGDTAEIMNEMGFEAIMPFYLQADLFLLQAAIIFVLAFIISLYPLIRIRTMSINQSERH